MLKVLLAPDRLAHYRRPVFNKIASKFELDIYAPKQKDSTGIEIASELGNNFKWISNRSFFLRNIGFWHTGIISASIFKDYDVYIFWGDSWNISVWISALICKALNKKVVFWTHGLYGNEGKIKLFYRLSFYKIADAMLLYGNHAKKELLKNNFDKNSLFVINNSLDFEVQNEIYNQIKNLKPVVSKQNKKLVFIGRLEPNKKIKYLLEALALINSNLKPLEKVSLLIIGDGSEKEDLKLLCEELGICESVTFYGACYDQKVIASSIINSDICVSPGNVGLTAMQSLIYGTPVVTHNDATRQMPEFEAVIENKSGVLYDMGSINSLADAITNCMTLLDSNVINADTCRDVIIRLYNSDYQLQIFNKMLKKCKLIRY